MKVVDKWDNNLDGALLFKFVAAILVVLAISLIEQKISILFWGGIWLALGWAICCISFSVKNRNRSLSIFYLFFTIYLLYSTLCNYFYVLDPTKDYFYSRDSLHFFEYSDLLGKLHSVNKIIDVSFTDFTSANWKAFALISGVVAIYCKCFG